VKVQAVDINYQRMHIAVVPNSIVVDLYKSAIIHAYTRLGIRVALHELPPGRSLPLTNAGKLDAEMVRTSLIETIADNLIRVPILLGEGKLMLYCVKDVVCDSTVFQQKEHLIGVINGTNITTLFMKDKTAPIYPMDSGSALGEKLRLKQLKYILSVDIKDQGNYVNLSAEQFQSYSLQSFKAYHYIHKKHEKLLAKLTRQLQKTINIEVKQ
jgi:hypothetical protein